MLNRNSVASYFKGVSALKCLISLVTLVTLAFISTSAQSVEVEIRGDRREIAFIDSRVEDNQVLVGSALSRMEIHILEPGVDGLSQIASVLFGRRGIDAIHVISHGMPGAIEIGNSKLSRGSLPSQGGDLDAVRNAMKYGGEILLYGCFVGLGPEGQLFVEELSKATHAVVTASTNATGAASLGGDWLLERSTGPRSTYPISSPQYSHILAAPRTFVGADTIHVRPGGASYTWTYAGISDVGYQSVDFPPSGSNSGEDWVLTRGKFQYSTNGGSSWIDYAYPSMGNDNVIPTAGKIWRFLDTLPADFTTNNTVDNKWIASGVPHESASFIKVDNAPTGINSTGNPFFFSDIAQGTLLANLTPIDTGLLSGGFWAIDSQTVPNLFTISFNSAIGNTATLNLGAGTMPTAGQTASVTVRYYDLYQTDGSGSPIGGQGFSKTLTFTIVDPQSNDLASFGNDFKVSTYTPNNQLSPAIASLSNGNFVAVWQSAGQGGEAASKNGIYGQIFGPTGTPVGGEFPITTAGNGIDETTPVVSALNSGRFVVAYTTTPGANALDIGYRIVEANAAVGGELIANTATAGAQTGPSIATLSDGSFVIAWVSAPTSATDTWGEIHAQKFNAVDGSKNGSELTVHQSALLADRYDAYPSVAALTGGAYAVAWNDGNLGSVSAIVSTAPSTIIPVDSRGLAYSTVRSAGLTGGGFVVAWDASNSGTGLQEIVFQRYNNAGVAQGSMAQANNTSGSGHRTQTTLSALSGGGFVIGWQSDTGDFDLSGIFGRRFSASGVAVDGTDYEVNQYRMGNQNSPVATGTSSDGFAVLWVDNTSDGVGNAGIEGRVYSGGPLTYSVTYSGNGNTGGTAPTDATAYLQAATVTVLGNSGSLVKSGSSFTNWNTVANGSGTAYAGGSTFSMGSSNVTLYAQWSVVPTYTIAASANPVSGGSMSCMPNPVTQGGASTCSATANMGYTFTGFTGDCTGVSCSLTNVNVNQSVTANFTLNTYSISTSASPLAGGTVSCTSNPVPHGGSSTCTATANSGYTFSSFSGSCAGAACMLNNVTSTQSITAAFTLNSYAIAATASPLAGGSVSCTPNPVSHGSDSTCTAVANSGYTFIGFSGGCTGLTCLLSSLTSAQNVIANFVVNTYAIATVSSPVVGGAVSCTANPVTHGGSSTCTATANAGYTFSAFAGSCSGASCVLTNVTSAQSISATFTLNTYSISTTAAPPAGGSVSCTPNPVAHGSNSTCTATANPGYTFTVFSGACTGATCALNSVSSAQSVTATFTLNTYAITETISPVAGGIISCTTNPVPHGGSSTCTATANPGYTFGAFSGSCTGATCLLNNVTTAQSVTATFTLNTYAVITTSSPVAGGSVSCTPSPVPYGSNSTCTATANPGYTFSAFSGACTGITCVLNNVMLPQSVTASFTLNTYTITATSNPPAGGTLTCTPSTVSHGSSTTCSATLNAGYTFNGISGDCTSATTNCILNNVQANRTLVATFTAIVPDPATIPPFGTLPPLPGIGVRPAILDLSGGVGPDMVKCLTGTLNSLLGGGFSYAGQQSDGSAHYTNSILSVSFYPLEASMGSGQPIGINLRPSNSLNVGTSCGTFNVSPAMNSLAEFGLLLQGMGGLIVNINPQGVLTVNVNGTLYSFRPDYLVGRVQGTGTANLVFGQDGIYRFIDSSGNVQTLHPAFIDPEVLVNQVAQAVSGATLIQIDGTAVVRLLNGQQFVLTPDLILGGIPPEFFGLGWWQENAIRYRYRVVTFPAASQGFSVSEKP